jgi:hypothetical protein
MACTLPSGKVPSAVAEGGFGGRKSCPNCNGGEENRTVVLFATYRAKGLVTLIWINPKV